MSFVSAAEHRDPREPNLVVPINPLAAGSMPGRSLPFEPHSPVPEEPRRLITTDALEQLDRWADEGGAIGAARAPGAV
jgi:hypothetical protein